MSGAVTKQLTCVQCPLGCALEACLDEADAVVHVSGQELPARHGVRSPGGGVPGSSADFDSSRPGRA